MKHLIFDFDGVLGDTENARNKIVSRMENKTLDQVLLDSNEYFSNPSHTRNHSITLEEKINQLTWTHRFGWEMLDEGYSFFEGFIAEIKKLQDVKMAIVSSGSKVYINRVKKCNLDFTHILDFFDHHSKEEKVEQVAKDWGVDINQVYYFTDTQTDVKELKNILDFKKIISCSWGYQGYDKLIEVLPKNQILKEFNQIHEVLR